MDRIRTILIVLLLISSGGTWAQEPVYNVGVDGLACPFCSAIFLVTMPVGVTSALITFNTTLPVPQNHYIYRQQLQWLRSDDDPSDAQRDMHVLAAVSVG